ncbi:MAG: restriction endonuclease subunit S, partial [Ruminococcus sp.]
MKYEMTKLSSICKTNTSSYSSKDKWNYVNYLDTGNIVRNSISEIQYINITTEKLPSRAKRKVKYNSILFSTVRPNQLHYGIIKNQPDNFLVSTGFTVIDIDEDKASADFIYYFLTQNDVIQHLQAIAEQSTSAYPSIKASDIEKLNIMLPNLDTQKKIAHILRSLDKKIELNDKINENLEQQAQAIFKSWFVDFEPFGGVMPDDWKISTLGEVSDMGAGGDKPKNATSMPTTENTIPIYSNGLTDEGLYGFTNYAKIQDESVTVSARGTVGFVCLRQVPYVPIVRLVTLIPNIEKISAKYLYHWLKILHIAGTGTTQ